MLVTVDEIKSTSLYPEIVDKITRGNTSEAERMIQMAEDKVKSYLSKYDIPAIFGTDDTEPTFNSPLLKGFIISIASWYLVKKANPNVNIELFRVDYEDTMDWLKDLQAGKVNPDLPYKPADDVAGESDDTDVFFSSNIKRTQSFQ